MKDLELLLPRVLEKAAACPEPTALRHLRDAAIEFCRRTRIWRESETFTLTEETCEAVVLEAGVSIYEISHAKYDDIDLAPVTIDWLDKQRPGWRDEEGTPCYLTQSSPNTVRVVPKPELDEDEDYRSLTLELILVPSHNAEQVPDVLIETYSREIADGAIGSVLLLKAEFADLQLGAFHTAEFQKAIGRFGDRVQRGQQRAKRRTTPSTYF